MRKSLFMACGVLFVIMSVTFISPINAATTWGVETDTTYKYELKNLIMFDTDLSLLLKDNVSMNIIFTEFNSTGYTYDVYNATGGVTSNSTNFVENEVEPGVFITMPNGLPMALPLSLGTIPDYITYFGQIMNQTTSFLFVDELLGNLTEFANVTYMDTHSILNENYLYLYFDLFATEVNASILFESMDMGSMGSFSFPSNFTNFKLNATINYNATSGLFNGFNIKLRSQGEVAPGYFEPFNVDAVYGLYIPPVPTTPTTPTPTEESFYPWIVLVVTFAVFGVFILRKRKRSF